MTALESLRELLAPLLPGLMGIDLESGKRCAAVIQTRLVFPAQ